MALEIIGIPRSNFVRAVRMCAEEKGVPYENIAEMPHSDAVKLTIHDTLGRRVRTLVSGTHVAGRHQVHWDGRDGGGGSVSSGVYFIRLATSESSLARRIILLR